MVGYARPARVNVGAAELLRGHVLPGRGLHQRRSADEDRARSTDDHGLVAHGRDVRAPGRTGADDDGDLRDALSGHLRLVVEDPPEVVAVGEDLVLQREKRAARVDQVDARQPVLLGDLLRAQVLLDRQREVRAALHRRIVGHDHALPAFDDADAGDDPRGRSLVVVHVPGRERVQLEEGRVRIDEPVDPFPGEELAARAVPLDRALSAARGHLRGALAQLQTRPDMRCLRVSKTSDSCAVYAMSIERNRSSRYPRGLRWEEKGSSSSSLWPLWRPLRFPALRRRRPPRPRALPSATARRARAGGRCGPTSRPRRLISSTPIGRRWGSGR